MAGTVVRVLVVDDSAFMRRILAESLTADQDIQVIGTARDGLDGVEKAIMLAPDVVTLDIDMPRLDGYGALRELMQQRPLPVIMVSSHTQAGTRSTIRSLALGAVDFLVKPLGLLGGHIQEFQAELRTKVRAAAGARPRPRPLLAEMPPLHHSRVAAAVQAGPAIPARRVHPVPGRTAERDLRRPCAGGSSRRPPDRGRGADGAGRPSHAGGNQ